MTLQSIRELADAELAEVIDWAQAEQKARTEKRKQETIAKMRELARSVGVSVAIGGARGRPAKATTNAPLRKRT